MRAVAEAFRAAHGIPVEIVAGPTSGWAGRVPAEADMVSSGAEYMMDDFMAQFREVLDPATRTTLFLRPSALLVRRGLLEGRRIGDGSLLLDQLQAQVGDRFDVGSESAEPAG
jgi:accessory colonization factor AcfC